jgi:HTH-type transcriptional regulator/antitoxin HigA
MNLNEKIQNLIHPGESLSETLEFLKMSQLELSIRTGLAEKTISEIINGKSSITPETALKLERSINIDSSFWNNLQKNYDEKLERIKADENLEIEREIEKNISCYDELEKLGLVNSPKHLPNKDQWKFRVDNLMKFFNVSSLVFINSLDSINIKFRSSKSKGELNAYNLKAWLRAGEVFAQNDLPEYDKNKLKMILDDLRKMTYFSGDLSRELKIILNPIGINIVCLPYFKNTKVNGAIRWYKDKPLIQLNTRGAYCDIFWFTLFHEIGHILLHGKKDQFLEGKGINKEDQKELEADNFAQNTLIPVDKYYDFIQNLPSPSSDLVTEFANDIGIDPSIVWGRLAHDEYINYASISNHRIPLKFIHNS